MKTLVCACLIGTTFLSVRITAKELLPQDTTDAVRSKWVQNGILTPDGAVELGGGRRIERRDTGPTVRVKYSRSFHRSGINTNIPAGSRLFYHWDATVQKVFVASQHVFVVGTAEDLWFYPLTSENLERYGCPSFETFIKEFATLK